MVNPQERHRLGGEASAHASDLDQHDRRYKYALLHLSDGIELLLKCRLQSEHWSLVVADIDKTTYESFSIGDFKSVAWQEIIWRLEQSGAGLGKDDKSLLEHLRKLRNRIQHFNVHIDPNEVNSTLAYGLNFATRFIELNKRRLKEETPRVPGESDRKDSMGLGDV